MFQQKFCLHRKLRIMFFQEVKYNSTFQILCKNKNQLHNLKKKRKMTDLFNKLTEDHNKWRKDYRRNNKSTTYYKKLQTKKQLIEIINKLK